MSRHRFDDPSRDLLRLAGRIATMITYGRSKKEIVDAFLAEGFTNDEVFLAYGAARVMYKKARAEPCGYCGSTDGFERGPDGWDACKSCGGI